MSSFFLNTATKALTKSTGNVFLRQFRIGSNHYGIDATGIYLISGNLDNGVIFDSLIKTTANSLSEEAKKRLTEIRVDKSGTISAALIYDGVAVSDGVEAGDSGFVRFGKGGGGKLIALLLYSNDENLKLRHIKLMSQTIGLGAL